MDQGRRGSQFFKNKNSKMYLDLKDVVRENALQFLPAKSLFRFRKVCKDWKLQISSPFFAHSQSINFRDVVGCFCQSGSNPPTFVSIDPETCGVPDPSLSFLPEPVDIRASSNGLLCCQGYTGCNAYYICNPVTKQWKRLPKPTAAHGTDPALVLIFEPSLLNFVAEYKLVCAFPCADFDEGYEFEIYDSKEGSWRISGEIYFGNKKLLPRSGVHANGIIYWQSADGGIFVFDLPMERSQLLYGDYECYGHRWGTLGEMDGKLCLANRHHTTLTVSVLSNSHQNTMRMNSNVKTWESKHHINLSSLELFKEEKPGHKPSCVLFAGGNVLLFQAEKKLFSYDLKTNQSKCVLNGVDRDMRVFGYVNSLVEI
ncbi:hypothetical protein UlMin_039502 [Ulmus minor]